MTVEQARGKASALNAALSKWRLLEFSGENPFKPRRRDPTLDALVEEYVSKRVEKKAAHPDRAAKAVRWAVKKYLASWRNRRIDSISEDDVEELHARLGRESGHVTANRTVQLLRRLFYWARKSRLSSRANPAARVVEFFPEDSRTRFLQPDEVFQFFTALKTETNADLRDFVKLAIFTGARRGDIFSMRWEDVAIDQNRWLVPDPKSGDPYLIALMPEAVEILKTRKRDAKPESRFVFASRGKSGHLVDLKGAWKKLLERAQITGLRQHDLRRTLGSWQAMKGSSLTVIGKSLGHKSLEATAVYSQIDLKTQHKSVHRATRAILAASKKKPKRIRVPKPKLLEAGRT